MRKVIQPQARKIMKIVGEFGGISNKQIKRLLPGSEEDSRRFYVNSLKPVYIEEKEKERYTSKTLPGVFTKSMEYCLWILLDNLKDDEGEEITYTRVMKPNQISFIKNNCCYNVCYIDRNTTSSIEILEQQYSGRKERYEEMIKKYNIEPFKQIIVVQDNSMVEMIETMNLEMPLIIACLNFDKEGYPNIVYLSE